MQVTSHPSPQSPFVAATGPHETPLAMSRIDGFILRSPPRLCGLPSPVCRACIFLQPDSWLDPRAEGNFLCSPLSYFDGKRTLMSEFHMSAAGPNSGTQTAPRNALNANYALVPARPLVCRAAIPSS